MYINFHYVQNSFICKTNFQCEQFIIDLEFIWIVEYLLQMPIYFLNKISKCIMCHTRDFQSIHLHIAYNSQLSMIMVCIGVCIFLDKWSQSDHLSSHWWTFKKIIKIQHWILISLFNISCNKNINRQSKLKIVANMYGTNWKTLQIFPSMKFHLYTLQCPCYKNWTNS